ncbi:1-acylglycerol-3-phosphate O-acyltransferase [Coemansia sp. RSA 1813]|nr:1-acylglycerol-3-phosphate O-acyltransferase [Coemansia sp. RSA 1646]KAJ1770099.1 1-acylglycerol-3-phosphate O-acyltransferase [Coemansia sp. RSA 1843]KAJ2089863.1 1-acylglycerol-3-phosphate O-acyltransferase [Coemansia sp. RSA 986]KAJ2214752.1 1-acylglycerol-3-phosphate O-acyltransferase [Coemansia sp. RSA 487]KAJ2569739.1 1-acylglycerol-3-phosphate O-acyltransferase [Coemansia sp. RSA 1813]
MHWLVWALLIDCCLALCSRLSRSINYGRRLVHFALCAVVASTAGILASPFLWAVGQQASGNWIVGRTFYYTTRALLGISIEIDGEELLAKARPCVLVGNHQTMFDLIMLGRIFPQQTVILAKKALSYYPLVGWFMRLSGDIFISRGSKQSSSDMFKRASQDLQSKNVSVWFFPEGTRGRFEHGPDLLPFKLGAFQLAYHAKVPIVPVVVMDFHNLYNKRRLWSAPGTLKIKILEPVSMDNVREEDLKLIMNQTRDRMLAGLREISPPRISIDA